MKCDCGNRNGHADTCPEYHEAVRAANATPDDDDKALLEKCERILIRTEDIQHGGADDETYLRDVDLLRREITRRLRPPIEHGEVTF
jgi:hypothetical protein